MKQAYINGIILDGTKDMEPQQDKVILTDGERIEAIVEKEQIKDKDLSGYEIVDLAGNAVLMAGQHLRHAGTHSPETQNRNIDHSFTSLG